MTNDDILQKLNTAITAMKGKQQRVDVEITDPNCPHLRIIATGKVNPAERGHVCFQCSDCGSVYSYPVSIAEKGFRNYRKNNSL